jgi:hypothetical protein
MPTTTEDKKKPSAKAKSLAKLVMPDGNKDYNDTAANDVPQGAGSEGPAGTVEEDNPGPEGSPAEEASETPAEEKAETTGSVETQAETLFNQCEMAGREVCKRVYKMLDEEYGKEERTTKKEVGKEKAAKKEESKPVSAYDTEGMPND